MSSAALSIFDNIAKAPNQPSQVMASPAKGGYTSNTQPTAYSDALLTLNRFATQPQYHPNPAPSPTSQMMEQRTQHRQQMGYSSIPSNSDRSFDRMDRRLHDSAQVTKAFSLDADQYRSTKRRFIDSNQTTMNASSTEPTMPMPLETRSPHDGPTPPPQFRRHPKETTAEPTFEQQQTISTLPAAPRGFSSNYVPPSHNGPTSVDDPTKNQMMNKSAHQSTDTMSMAPSTNPTPPSNSNGDSSNSTNAMFMQQFVEHHQRMQAANNVASMQAMYGHQGYPFNPMFRNQSMGMPPSQYNQVSQDRQAVPSAPPVESKDETQQPRQSMVSNQMPTMQPQRAMYSNDGTTEKLPSKTDVGMKTAMDIQLLLNPGMNQQRSSQTMHSMNQPNMGQNMSHAMHQAVHPSAEQQSVNPTTTERHQPISNDQTVNPTMGQNVQPTVGQNMPSTVTPDANQVAMNQAMAAMRQTEAMRQRALTTTGMNQPAMNPAAMNPAMNFGSMGMGMPNGNNTAAMGMGMAMANIGMPNLGMGFPGMPAVGMPGLGMYNGAGVGMPPMGMYQWRFPQPEAPKQQKRLKGPGTHRKCWLCVVYGKDEDEKQRIQMKWQPKLGKLVWADGHGDNFCPSLNGRATLVQAAAAKRAWSQARSKRSEYRKYVIKAEDNPAE